MLDAQLVATHRFRRTDPGTSMVAAERADGLAADHKDLIHGLLQLAKRPMGATEIAGKLGLTQVQVCRRLPELQREGAIRVADGQGRTPTGRPERLWEAA